MRPDDTGTYWDRNGCEVDLYFTKGCAHVDSPGGKGWLEFYCCREDLSDDYTPVPTFNEYKALLEELRQLREELEALRKGKEGR